MSIFPAIFVPLPIFLCLESTSYVLSLNGVFLPCDHGLDFLHEFFVRNQSINTIKYIKVIDITHPHTHREAKGTAVHSYYSTVQ